MPYETAKRYAQLYVAWAEKSVSIPDIAELGQIGALKLAASRKRERERAAELERRAALGYRCRQQVPPLHCTTRVSASSSLADRAAAVGAAPRAVACRSYTGSRRKVQ